jgi:hypothetical protein
MNKKILTKTLLPIATVALLGGGIASSLVLSSCGNKTIILRSKAEVDKYLMDNSQNCDFFDASVNDANLLTEPQLFYNFILPHYTKQAFINGLISDFLKVAGNNMSIIINNNSFILNQQKNDEKVKTSYEFVKWSALNDSAIFISGSGGKSFAMIMYPEAYIESYYGRIQYTTGYERPDTKFNLDYHNEGDASFSFFLSKFDFTNIRYSAPS